MPKKETTKEEVINPNEDKVIINIAPPTEEEEGKGTYVSVNEYNAVIKYGEDVLVPRYVADLFKYRKMALDDKKRNEEKRDAKTAKM